MQGDGSGILTWTPVGSGLYEFPHQQNWVEVERSVFQMQCMINSNCLSTDHMK